jgi:hypothetical protein
MKKQENKSDPNFKEDEDVNKKYPGYPVYPEEDDIYNKLRKESDVNPEDISQKKDFIETSVSGKKKGKNEDGNHLSGDLDVPGSELDNDLENTGSEDEENNYYSLGGDNHEDLEEDRSSDDRM